jgi:hypothetical protein
MQFHRQLPLPASYRKHLAASLIVAPDCPKKNRQPSKSTPVAIACDNSHVRLCIPHLELTNHARTGIAEWPLGEQSHSYFFTRRVAEHSTPRPLANHRPHRRCDGRPPSPVFLVLPPIRCSRQAPRLVRCRGCPSPADAVGPSGLLPGLAHGPRSRAAATRSPTSRRDRAPAAAATALFPRAATAGLLPRATPSASAPRPRRCGGWHALRSTSGRVERVRHRWTLGRLQQAHVLNRLASERIVTSRTNKGQIKKRR